MPRNKQLPGRLLEIQACAGSTAHNETDSPRERQRTCTLPVPSTICAGALIPCPPKMPDDPTALCQKQPESAHLQGERFQKDAASVWAANKTPTLTRAPAARIMPQGATLATVCKQHQPMVCLVGSPDQTVARERCRAPTNISKDQDWISHKLHRPGGSSQARLLSPLQFCYALQYPCAHP